ncbi:MAG: septum formation protein Maf [Ruminococcaceae bacterium]|nr:septum formation protein Maf [Oscillospiraceae bacterium]
MRKIILASASPRRREILQKLGLDFRVLVADVDESSDERDPGLLCASLARRKGEAVLAKLKETGELDPEAVIIASDTVVAVETGDGWEIFGKPKNEDDARRMLSILSGRSHFVYSGVYLWSGGRGVSSFDRTEVVFKVMTEEQINGYIASGEPFGKAGSYAIQGLAGAFIERTCGDYYTVVGLPVNEMCRLYCESFPEAEPLVETIPNEF